MSGVNGPRGEVALQLGGREVKLCLTLGALAEIETALGCKSMAELDVRMRALSATDLHIVLAALLRGGEERDVQAGDVAPGVAAQAVADAFRIGLAV